ncbi:MAG TPA: hypothetical protein VLB32_06675 [Candidatus Acidoferrales bacterium]|nr:hypothetical protein [Candidatus Acidoferrales bacterium]
MRRIAFRRVLPIIQLALAAGLLLLGHAQEQTLRADNRERELARMGPPKPLDRSQQGVAWDLESLWDGYTPPAAELCVAINLPGMILSIPLAILLGLAMQAAGIDQGLWLYYVGYAPGIVLLWWYVGRWLDVRRGLIPLKQQPPPPDRGYRQARDLVAVFAILAFVMALLCFTRTFRHYPYTVAGFVLWPGLVSVVYIFEMRRWRALARAAASSSQP